MTSCSILTRIWSTIINIYLTEVTFPTSFTCTGYIPNLTDVICTVAILARVGFTVVCKSYIERYSGKLINTTLGNLLIKIIRTWIIILSLVNLKKKSLWFLSFIMLTFSYCIIFPISSLQKLQSENRVQTISHNYVGSLLLMCPHVTLIYADIEAISLQGTSAGNFALDQRLPHWNVHGHLPKYLWIIL